jgi:hypothetical protein
MTDEANWVAVQVLVKPQKTKAPTMGAVIDTDEENGQITIMTPNGKKHVVGLPDDTEIPEEGEVVTVFEDPSDPSGGEGDGMPLKAKGLVKASQIRHRLEQHLAELTVGDEDLTEEDAELVNQLAGLLENNAGQKLGILKKVANQYLSEEEMDSVAQGVSQAEAAQQEAKGKAEAAKAKAGKPEDKGKPDNPGSNGAATGQSDAEDDGEGADSGPPSDKGNNGNGSGKGKSGKNTDSF